MSRLSQLCWRVQRAYGDVRLFASRKISDVVRAGRDMVHHTITHSKPNYPGWVDANQPLKLLAVRGPTTWTILQKYGPDHLG